MDLLKNKFLWIPPLVLSAIFLLDKIFLLPNVLEYTVSWMKIEPPFYKSREPLLEQLARSYPARKDKGERLGVILGTSRTGEFSTGTFAKHIPKSYTYNFSVPLGCPSYHNYWLGKILEAGAVPAFVVIEAEPIMFTQNAISYSLSYSYDPVFVFERIDWTRSVPRNVWDIQKPGFSFDEAETYFLKRAFALYRYPFDPAVIRENLKTITVPDDQTMFREIPRLEFRRVLVANLETVNREHLGGIPNPLSNTVPPSKMEEDAELLKNQHLLGFNPAPTQLSFFKGTIQSLAERRIPTVVYWPLVSAPYRRKTSELGLLKSFKIPLQEFLDKTMRQSPGSRIILVDPNDNKQIKCRQFADAHHLMGACFDEVTGLIAENLFPK